MSSNLVHATGLDSAGMARLIEENLSAKSHDFAKLAGGNWKPVTLPGLSLVLNGLGTTVSRLPVWNRTNWMLRLNAASNLSGKPKRR